VAGKVIPARVSLIGVILLIVLRGAMAGLLPLSADEAYYWLWSKHLALGYFDHPPMIAWLIRAGTLVFGDDPLGVRGLGVILSLPASWFVWRTAALILKDENPAALAALLFNLTLMTSVEMLAATPDMPSIVTSAAFVYFLAQVQATGNAKWWLGAGIAAGLGLLSKFSILFLGMGTLIWLAVDAPARRWLRTPWPHFSAALALVVFAPALVWQSQHHWMTFAFQFGRVGGGHFTLRFLGEFLAAQLGLATPLIFILMAIGLWRATRRGNANLGNDRLLLAVLAWTGIAYFLEHSLHDRVQGNWPCFLYPVLAILAADAFVAAASSSEAVGLKKSGWRKISMIAAPLALVMLLAVYAQALFAPVALRQDPLARVLGRDFQPIGDVTAAMVKAHLADAILTTDYETTAWLRFTEPSVQVVQVNEPQRYEGAPMAPAALLNGRLIYLAEFRRDQHHLVAQSFAYTGFPTQLQTPSSLWMIYPVGRPKSSPLGRMP
jgi:4-amino-4-deoxy-L-arabinose transferase-like glycosyltransferase